MRDCFSYAVYTDDKMRIKAFIINVFGMLT
jgi:hypothetical protein